MRDGRDGRGRYTAGLYPLNKRLTLFITEREKEDVRNKAADNNVTFAAYVRTMTRLPPSADRSGDNADVAAPGERDHRERMPVLLSVRISGEELQSIAARAKARRKTMSEFVRQQLRRTFDPAYLDDAILTELTR